MEGQDKIYSMITERITNLLENGTIPWHKPWKGGEAPVNFINKKPYRGINTFILNAMGFNSRYWMTYNQAVQKGGQVRKGEKGSPCIFWKWIEVEDRDNRGKMKKIPFLRYYTVFNLDQIDGIENPNINKDNVEFNHTEKAQSIINNMPNKPSITYDGGRAYYIPKTDVVNVPKKETFDNNESFYATNFHELGHSTGHKDRLGRKGIMDVDIFGSNTYSQEELIAEMTAAYLCGESGIENTIIENSAAYIQGWLRVLNNDKKMVLKAASQAQKAADYILGKKSVEENDGN